MAAGQGVLDLLALPDPEHRRMLQRRMGDAVGVEEGEQVFGGLGGAHAAVPTLDARRSAPL